LTFIPELSWVEAFAMQSQNSNDENAIRQLVATWISASEAGDTKTILSLMSDEVLFLIAGHPPMNKQGFIDAQQAMQGMKLQGSSDVQEVSVSGDLAYCWTKLSVTATPAGHTPVKRAGNVLSVLRREGGRWVIFRDANMLVTVDA
jgi:uncharacterized protein (TIGR02246 family)